MSITHAVLKAIVPEIAFIFMILIFLLISVISYKLTLFKAFKNIFKLIAIMFSSEILLHVFIFKILGFQINPNNNLYWVMSGILTLVLVIVIKRKELFKNGYAFLG